MNNIMEMEERLYRLSVQGIGSLIFRHCEGLEASLGVRYAEGCLSGQLAGTSRGEPAISPVSLCLGSGERSPSVPKSLFQWFLEVYDYKKALDKRNVSIQLLESGGLKNDDADIWELVNAWPCRWRGPLMNRSDGIAIENVEFAYEGLQIKPAKGSKVR